MTGKIHVSTDVSSHGDYCGLYVENADGTLTLVDELWRATPASEQIIEGEVINKRWFD